MRATTSISFYCRASKADRNGYAPIELSVCVSGKRVFVQLQKRELPDVFSKAMASRKCTDTKTYTEHYRQLAYQAITDLTIAEIPLTASAIRDYVINGGIKAITLQDLTRTFLSYEESRIDNGITLGVYRKYELVCQYLVTFFGDRPADSITHADILRLQAKTLQDFTQQTSAGYLSKAKTFFSYLYNDGKITRNPFLNIHITKGNPKIEFLTDQELETLWNYHTSIERLERVKDMFLFSCYSGMSYTDLIAFNPQDIKITDGTHIYVAKRKKTKITFTSVLLVRALQILEKYGNNIPRISNQKMNTYLKELEDLCHIEKNLHFHLARKTYGHILINSGVPMSTVAKCLGHSSTAITQKIYAITDTDTIASQVASALDCK